jgi:hypothetical protein
MERLVARWIDHVSTGLLAERFRSLTAKHAHADTRLVHLASVACTVKRVEIHTRDGASLSKVSIFQAVLTISGMLSIPNDAGCVARKHLRPGLVRASHTFYCASVASTPKSYDSFARLVRRFLHNAIRVSAAGACSPGSIFPFSLGVVAPIGHLSSSRSTAMFASLAPQTASSMRCPPSRQRVSCGGVAPHAARAG